MSAAAVLSDVRSTYNSVAAEDHDTFSSAWCSSSTSWVEMAVAAQDNAICMGAGEERQEGRVASARHKNCNNCLQ
jgi:hypothetical protein